MHRIKALGAGNYCIGALKKPKRCLADMGYGIQKPFFELLNMEDGSLVGK